MSADVSHVDSTAPCSQVEVVVVVLVGIAAAIAGVGPQRLKRAPRWLQKLFVLMLPPPLPGSTCAPGSGCRSVSSLGNCRCGSSASEEGSPAIADVIHAAATTIWLQVEVVVV